MQAKLYVVLALTLWSSVTWGDGYRSGYRSNPYGAYGNTYAPTSAINPYTSSASQFYDSQGHYRGPLNSNSSLPNTATPSGNYRNSNNAQNSVGNPYSPYNTPNSYRTNGNPYATDSINTPYNDSPDRAMNQYGANGNTYNPNPVITPYPQNTVNNPYDPNNSYDQPNSVTDTYDPNNPYSPNNVAYPYGSSA
ncbi:MAG: hypothetical protein ACU83U_04735, partial [Gammaproteobacteria bacterium]